MKPKTLAILAALVAVLAAFVYFFEKSQPSSEARAAAAKKLVAAEADDVTALVVEWGGVKTRLEREPETAAETTNDPAAAWKPKRWKLVEPLAAPADGPAVTSLVESILGATSVRTLEGAARADVGLEPPRGLIRIETKQGESVIEVGGKVPASSTVVVAVAGQDGLRVVSDAFVANLGKAPGDWRSKEAFGAGRDEVERWAVRSSAGAQILLAKRGDAFWMESPVADAASRDLVDRLITAATGLKVDSFLDAPPADVQLGLAPPLGTIEAVVKGRSEPIRIEIGGPVPDAADKRYLRVGDLRFVGGGGLAEFVERAPDDWRSPAWTTFASYEVESAKVSDATGTIALTRSGGDWLRDGAKIGYSPVADLLYAVTSAKAERVEADPAAGAPAIVAATTLVWTGKEGKEETLVLTAPDAVGGAAARSSARAVTLHLPAETVKDVLARIADLRKAEPEKPAEPDEKP